MHQYWQIVVFLFPIYRQKTGKWIYYLSMRIISSSEGLAAFGGSIGIGPGALGGNIGGNSKVTRSFYSTAVVMAILVSWFTFMHK